MKPTLRPSARVPSLLALGAALATFSVPLAADSDEFSARVTLSLFSASGSTTTFVVRSTLPDALVVCLSSPEPGVLELSSALPLLSLASAEVAATGWTGPDGAFWLNAPTPPVGTTFSLQTLLVDPRTGWLASRRATLTIGANHWPSLDETASLPNETTGFSALDVDFGDFDRSGCPDAIVANDGPGAEPLILTGSCDGNGFSNEAFVLLPTAARRPTSCVEIGDVNNDGHPDLFLGGGSDPDAPLGNLLVVNDGTGSFEIASGPSLEQHPRLLAEARPCPLGTSGCVELPRLPQGYGYASDAEFGDVDADGDLDLLVINVQDFDHPEEVPDRVTLYRNQGGKQGGLTGAFVQDIAFDTLPSNMAHGASGDVTLGDLDFDGDLDVFVSSVAGQNQLFRNDGEGFFTDVTGIALPQEVGDAFEADLGDFDGDGDLDIFVANNLAADPSAINLYENRTATPGVPFFVDGSANLPASFGPVTRVRLSTDVGDLDGDGDLDIVCGIHELPGAGGASDGETVLLVNQGYAQGGTQGTFAVDPTFVPGLFIAGDVALEDVDVDGDLDLYLASTGNLFQTDFHSELWLNSD